MKTKRQNHFRSTIEKTRSMLELIVNDINYCQNQFHEKQMNQERSLFDSILISSYFSYLSQYSFDQRQQFLDQWKIFFSQTNLSIREQFHLIEILLNQQGFSFHFDEQKKKK